MFQFQEPGPLIDGDLELHLLERYAGDPKINHVPAYKFTMAVRAMAGAGEVKHAGSIGLRIGNLEAIRRYFGHIGYGVDEGYRGHRYAARACRLLLPLARAHGMEDVIITCSPDNPASRRTCELAGARLLEIVELPEDNILYERGERQVCRYQIGL